MPILTYLCDACGSDHEEITRHSAPCPACPKCGGATRHGVGRVSARFGVGFARDGYISVGPKMKEALKRSADEASRGPKRKQTAAHGF